jgi:hypothetical protein
MRRQPAEAARKNFSSLTFAIRSIPPENFGPDSLQLFCLQRGL